MQTTGRIEIAIFLNDSTMLGSRPQYLGSHPVGSSEPASFRLSRAPVDEVLRFVIPAKTTIQRFDGIKVVFLPSPERSLAGVKIAIREFLLLSTY
jgi:hypothetical protein